eukprot:COSAG01_NODE_1617_length_9718_cov_267.124545_6_plen_167_part_00
MDKKHAAKNWKQVAARYSNVMMGEELTPIIVNRALQAQKNNKAQAKRLEAAEERVRELERQLQAARAAPPSTAGSPPTQQEDAAAAAPATARAPAAAGAMVVTPAAAGQTWESVVTGEKHRYEQPKWQNVERNVLRLHTMANLHLQMATSMLDRSRTGKSMETVAN